MTVTLLGQTLDGRYRLDAPLGAGAMGEVYRGMQVSLMRPVAIKILPRRLMTHQDVVQRFEREAQLLSRLKHPGIVSVIDCGFLHGRPYLVMELVEGQSLEQALGDDGKLPPERVARVMLNLCEALDHAHAMGVLHRDLKPSNILLEDAKVRVVDFGVARALEHGNANITGEGMVLGTPKYCSPEQAMGLSLDGRSDLYALGVVGWRMLAGRVPFEGEGPAAIFSRHVLEVPPPIAEVAGLSSEWLGLGTVIDRLLAKAPGDRYASALDTARALESVLSSIAPASPRPTISVPPMPALDDGRSLASLDTSHGPTGPREGPAPTAVVRRVRDDRAGVDGAAADGAAAAQASAASMLDAPLEAQRDAPSHLATSAALDGAAPPARDHDTDGHTRPDDLGLAATHHPDAALDDDAHDTLLDHIARPYLDQEQPPIDESAFAPTARSRRPEAPERPRSWLDRHPGLAVAGVATAIALAAWIAATLSAPPAASHANVPLPPLAVEARSMIARGEAAQAVTRLQDAVEKQPKDAALRVALAHAYVRAEQADAAIPHYLWAAKRAPQVFDDEHAGDLSTLAAARKSPVERLELVRASERIGDRADVLEAARAALEGARCDDKKAVIKLLRERDDADAVSLLDPLAKAKGCGSPEAKKAIEALDH